MPDSDLIEKREVKREKIVTFYPRMQEEADRRLEVDPFHGLSCYMEYTEVKTYRKADDGSQYLVGEQKTYAPKIWVTVPEKLKNSTLTYGVSVWDIEVFVNNYFKVNNKDHEKYAAFDGGYGSGGTSSQEEGKVLQIRSFRDSNPQGGDAIHRTEIRNREKYLKEEQRPGKINEVKSLLVVNLKDRSKANDISLEFVKTDVTRKYFGEHNSLKVIAEFVPDKKKK